MKEIGKNAGARAPAAAPVEYKVMAYQEVTPTDDPDVFNAKLWLLAPGMRVPEGCTPLYWKVGENVPHCTSLNGDKCFTVEDLARAFPASTPAAPVDPSKLGAAMRAFDDAGGHAISYAPAWMRKALEAASTPAAPEAVAWVPPSFFDNGVVAATARRKPPSETAVAMRGEYVPLYAAPVAAATGIDLATAIRNCCEAEKADPDHPDTICINVNELTAILQQCVLDASPKGGSDADLWRWFAANAAKAFTGDELIELVQNPEKLREVVQATSAEVES